MSNDISKRMNAILHYIQTNLDSNIQTSHLAAVAFYSESHLHRLFKGQTGESLKEHIRRLRMERAALRLLTRDQSVTEIALDAGYQTLESFSRAFKKRFGSSPAYFREQRRETIKRMIEQESETTAKRGSQTMKADLKTFSNQLVLSLRHTGPYQECGKVWESLCAWAGPKGLINEKSIFMGLCYDDPSVTPAEKIRYDACISISEVVETEGDIVIQEVNGKYAATLHKGPYENLEQTYIALVGKTMPEMELEPGDGPCIEIYLNDPTNTAPEDLLTEVLVPVKGS